MRLLHTECLLLTTVDLDEYVYAALRAGTGGFLLKDTPPRDLLAAIRMVAAGEALLAPTVTRRLIADFTRRPEPKPLAGVATVKSHVGRLLAKPEARDRAQLVIAAYEAGLVSHSG